MSHYIQTVLGLISPEELGRTLTHEHFSLDFNKFYVAPPDKFETYLDNKITLDNVGVVRQYPYSNKYNVAFNDADTHAAVLAEMHLYRRHGGGGVVENTTHGLQRDAALMHRVSAETGVHVVAGTGHYVAAVQPPEVLALTREQIYEIMKKEMTVGCEEMMEVRCGIIGEVGSNWPLHPFEKRCIQATADVQAELGCPVSFHPGRHPDAPFEILRIYAEAGGHIDKAVMSHVDRTLVKDEDVLRLADLGGYCQLDLFGTECLLYQFNPAVDMPSDNQRVATVIRLLEEGRGDKILLAHDIHTKHRLMAFGGHGFSHIQNNVLPKLLAKGISEDVIDQITIFNPGTWLSSPWVK